MTDTWIDQYGYEPSGIVAVPTMAQLRQGLADPLSSGYDQHSVVETNIPPSVPHNAVADGWRGTTFPQGSSIYRFVQTQLALSDAEMLLFYTSLLAYPSSPNG